MWKFYRNYSLDLYILISYARSGPPWQVGGEGSEPPFQGERGGHPPNLDPVLLTSNPGPDLLLPMVTKLKKNKSARPECLHEPQ